MRHHRSATVTALVTAMAIAIPVTGAQARSHDDGRIPREQEQEHDDGGEYVVAYEPAAADQAMQAIEAAGGVIEDVQEQVGLALVSADAGFATTVEADASITEAVQNVSIGATREGTAQVRATDRLTAKDDVARGSRVASGGGGPRRGGRTEPLEHLQWDMEMIGATRAGAHRTSTGRGVTVGVMDTGVDAYHPDIFPNFSWELSRNFTRDIPAIDGPCDTPTCIDPPWVDEGGHGTHVAGTIAAARNGVGITGVAPRATIVNIRAGQDSGYFFFYETVSALLYAGDINLDVVNMSFYTDPWLYNCGSADEYVSGAVTKEQLDEQAMIRTAILTAVEYAHSRGVTLVASLGNGHTNLAAPTRVDTTSPDYPPGTSAPRTVKNTCLDLPAEAPHVISVSAVGPSGTKADYSNYGAGNADVAAPGGWFRDWIGTDRYRTNENLILSSYPYEVAEEEGYFDVDENGEPLRDDFVESCDRWGRCAVWVYLQGTSMASPHVAGEAALIVQAHGQRRRGGYSLDPDSVTSIVLESAKDHACPVGGTEIYTDEGRPEDFNAICEGDAAYNGLYGEGIIDAVAAVTRK